MVLGRDGERGGRHGGGRGRGTRVLDASVDRTGLPARPPAVASSPSRASGSARKADMHAISSKYIARFMIDMILKVSSDWEHSKVLRLSLTGRSHQAPTDPTSGAVLRYRCASPTLVLPSISLKQAAMCRGRVALLLYVPKGAVLCLA